MAGQGKEIEGRAVDSAQAPRGYPPGLFGPGSLGPIADRKAIPTRYPAALRDIIAGQPESVKPWRDEDEGVVSQSSSDSASEIATPGKMIPPASHAPPATQQMGTFSVVSDELREVAGAITEGLGLFVRLPFFIAGGMQRKGNLEQAAVANSTLVPPNFLDLDEAARTLEAGFSAPAVDATLPNDGQAVAALSQPHITTVVNDASNNLPVVYKAPVLHEQDGVGRSDLDSLPAVMQEPGPSRGRVICVASVTAVFKSCRFMGRVAKFSVVGVPRFMVGVVREAAEASRPPKVPVVSEGAKDESVAAVSIEAKGISNPAENAPPDDVVQEATVDVLPPVLPPEPVTPAQQVDVSEVATEDREAVVPPTAEAPSVEAADIEAMVQAAIEAYAENLKRAAAESPTLSGAESDEQDASRERDKPESQAEDVSVAAEMLSGDEVLDEGIEEVPVASPAHVIDNPKPVLRTPIPAVSDDWPVAPKITAHLEDHEEEGTAWAEGIFYAGLGTLLLTILGSSLMFALGFVINLAVQGLVSVSGVLLMVGGVGGVMIAVMLLNEWLSALRFQLSAAVRLLVRCAGVLAAAMLLFAFVATTIPREHWPI